MFVFVCIWCWLLSSDLSECTVNVAPSAPAYTSSRYSWADSIHGFCLRFVGSRRLPCHESGSRAFARIYSWLQYGNASSREFRANFCTSSVIHFELDVEHHSSPTKSSLRVFSRIFGIRLHLEGKMNGINFPMKKISRKKKKRRKKKKQNWLVASFDCSLKRWQKNAHDSGFVLCLHALKGKIK